MAGMRKTPPGVHREPGSPERPPVWWVIWRGPPHAEGSVIIGRSKRLERHLWHRFFPERAGAGSRDIEGWVNGVAWLAEVHDGPAAH